MDKNINLLKEYLNNNFFNVAISSGSKIYIFIHKKIKTKIFDYDNVKQKITIDNYNGFYQGSFESNGVQYGFKVKTIYQLLETLLPFTKDNTHKQLLTEFIKRGRFNE